MMAAGRSRAQAPRPRHAFPQIYWRDDAGMTPLHHAASHGNLRVADLLLECAAEDAARR